MKAFVASIVLFPAATSAMAQMRPVGLWRIIDDKTGEAKGELRVTASGGALAGRLERSLRKDPQPDATRDGCPDDGRGKPITGLEIVRGGTKAEGQDVWEGGKILDPENGNEYRASFTPIDGRPTLQVRGCLGPFWRTQTWNRVQ